MQTKKHYIHTIIQTWIRPKWANWRHTLLMPNHETRNRDIPISEVKNFSSNGNDYNVLVLDDIWYVAFIVLKSCNNPTCFMTNKISLIYYIFSNRNLTKELNKLSNWNYNYYICTTHLYLLLFQYSSNHWTSNLSDIYIYRSQLSYRYRD